MGGRIQSNSAFLRIDTIFVSDINLKHIYNPKYGHHDTAAKRLSATDSTGIVSGPGINIPSP